MPEVKMKRIWAVQVETAVGWAWHHSPLSKQFSIFSTKYLAHKKATDIRHWNKDVKTRVVEIEKIMEAQP